MGFNSVYRVLQDVFPQVDTRLLRAVAIEHPKDADAAVEVVLAEIIPFLPGQTAASGSSTDSTYGSYQYNRSEDEYHVPESAGSIASTSYNDLNDDSNEVLVKHEKDKVEIWHDATSSGTLIDDNSADDDCKQLNVNVKNEEVTPLQELSSVEAGFNQDSEVSTTTSKDGNNCTNGIDNGSLRADCDDFSVLFPSDGNMVSNGRCWQDQACCNPLQEDHSVVQLASPTLQECRPATPEDRLQLAVDHALNSDYEKPEPSDNCNSYSKKEICATERTDFEEEPALNSVVTRSGQICRIDLLEDIVENARNNKKTLFSAVESVIVLMREVELQEKAAEQAKEDAVRGGLDILTSVEDLKEMLKQAKEANDMHAGEVYGERAILATEVRELQFRLFSLSDERDKSLAILDEMHKTLAERLQAAEEERKEAEQEQKEKEEAARNALAEQQLIMEKVVQESETLKLESEENSKLREFLMDRGRLVDMLQGEISVICQDVKLLKKKFDEHVPLSKSLSSSQTSCILASSSSSLKSMAPDQVAEQAESPETLGLTEVTEPSLSANNHVSPGEEREGDDTEKRLVEDDGWEWFDNQELDL